MDWDAWQSADNPALAAVDRAHGPRLLALGCELVWATAWRDDANDVIAPLLGLPRAPVAELPEWEADRMADGLHWKTRTLVRTAAGRPFVWLDDELTERDRAWVAQHHPGPALLVQVVAAHGLTEADLAEVARWLGADARGGQDPDAAGVDARSE